jgi:predicted ATPase
MLACRAILPQSAAMEEAIVMEDRPEEEEELPDVPALFNPEEFGGEAVGESTGGEGLYRDLAATQRDEADARPLKIRRIRMKSILGFEDSLIFPDAFSVLVGANNSGKSSLMRVVAFAQTLLRAHFIREDGDDVLLARGRNLDDALLPVPRVPDLWFRGTRRVGNEWVMAEVELEFEDGTSVAFGMKGPFGHATSRLLMAQQRIARTVYETLIAYPIVYIPSSVGVVDREEYRTPARIGSLIAGGRAHEVLRNLLLDLQESSRLDEVAAILAQYFEGSIESVSFNLASDEFIHVTYREDSHHDLFSAGAGFLQVLQLVTFLVHARPGILLVDEPDAHLHSSLQRVVVDILRGVSQQRGLQVLVATHSKEIINYVDPGELLVIDRKQREMRELGEHESAISVLESLGSVDSIDAYQVITQRKVLLVEGPSDRKILSTIAPKLDVHIFEGPDRLVVVETGGESTPQARTDLGILERIMDREVRSLQLLDRDARLGEYVDGEEARSARPLHIWRRDSIESYLLVPDTLARLVVSRSEGLNLDEVREFVLAALNQAIEELGESTFDRVATRYRRDVIATEQRNVEVAEANERARVVLADAAEAQRLTSGKDLLARVRKMLQEKYGVSFGNQSLLAEMKAEELDEELVDVLKQVEGLARS